MNQPEPSPSLPRPTCASASVQRPQGPQRRPEALADVQQAAGHVESRARPADRAPAQAAGPLRPPQRPAPGRPGAARWTWRRPRSTRWPPSITTSTWSRKASTAPAALTVRVCDGLSCEMAGAADLLQRLPAICWAREVRGHRRTLHRPLRAGAGGGRGPASAGRTSTGEAVSGCRAGRGARRTSPTRPCHRLRRLPEEGGYALLKTCIAGELEVETVIKERWKTRACAAWAARASRPGASGASCAAKPRRA